MSGFVPSDKSATCPDTYRLCDFSQGLLPILEMTVVADHLEQCPRCLETLTSFDSVSDPLILDLQKHSKAPYQTPEEQPDLRKPLEEICQWACSATILKEPWPAAFLDVSLGEGLPRRVGPYDLLEQLGRGGMGMVYKARHCYLDRLAAVKLLPVYHADNPQALARFRKEMQAIGQLHHPNIVHALDANVEGMAYLAMEYIDGADLSRLITQWGPFTTANACECTRQAALALQQLNEHGLVHRDVKPSNLMLDRNGTIKLVDLGLAQIGTELQTMEGETVTDLQVTAAGAIMGTMDYVAPEQLLDSRNVDIRADLYSLGCTLYHLLIGRPLFAGAEISSASRSQAHLLHDPPNIREERPDISEDLAALLEQLLAKKPEQRFPSPAALALALHPFTQDSHLHGLLENVPTKKRRKDSSSSGFKARSDPSFVPGRPDVAQGLPAASRNNLWLAAVCFLLVALLTVSVLVFLNINTLREQAGLPAPGKDEKSALIKSMDIDHLRGQKITSPWLGRVGVQTEPILTSDSIRVHAHFAEPVWCYLMRLHPDGRDELCFPQNTGEIQKARRQLAWPARGTVALQGQAGMHAFFLVASRDPLPDYQTFKASLEATWPSAPLAPDGVYTYDGHKVLEVPLGNSPPKDSFRSPGFRDLCRSLTQHSDTDAVYGIAFPVHKKEFANGTPP